MNQKSDMAISAYHAPAVAAIADAALYFVEGQFAGLGQSWYVWLRHCLSGCLRTRAQ